LTAALAAALLALLAAASKPNVVVRKNVAPTAPAPVASVRILDGTLERGRGGAWRGADRDFRISPGESLRTSADGAALLTFPWMQILVGGGAVVGLTPSTILSVTLERGRVQERATAGDILKVITAEGEVRGRGDVVVTRSEVSRETRVSALSGWFRVRSPQGMVFLDAGQGAIVTAAGPPAIVELPAPPTGLDPGRDPRYVEQGRAARLSWTGSAPRYRAHVLSLSGDETVLSREVQGSSTLDVPGRWLGTFQWRVSSIDARGVEGPPSAPGLFCVVET
jgi:hypothetical protein